MAVWRDSLALAVCLIFGTGCPAQPSTHAEPVKLGECFRVELTLKLTGEMRIKKDDKVAALPLKTTGHHQYDERILSLGATGLPDKSARYYEDARASIVVASDRSERTLRNTRRLLVATRGRDQAIVFSPQGSLTRAELELVGEHFDSLAVPGLLPAIEIKPGATWKIPNVVAQALCSFEGLSEHDLQGKLLTIDKDVATFSITGSAKGIDQGAQVKLTIEATGRFDLATKCLVGLEWKQKDERQQGPVSPESAVESTTVLTRKPIKLPDTLSDVALVSVPEKEVPATMLNLEAADAKGRFELLHGREWQAVSQSADHLVLRLVERGDLVAQATITPWKSAPKGQHLTPEAFKAAMHNTQGWDVERELQAGEVPTEGAGRWTYRLSEQGQLDGLPVVQNFYLIASPGGEQVVVAVTMTPKAADKLGARDLSLVGSIEIATGK